MKSLFILSPWILVGYIAGLVCAQEQTNMTCLNNGKNTISVRGSGSTTVGQDTANVRLAIQKVADTAVEAQQSTITSIDNVIASLKTYNITNLQTETISLQPLYNYTQSPASLIGFQTNYIISYDISPDKAGETLDTAIRMGANRIDSFELKVSPEVHGNAFLESLSKAVKNAKTKADTLAEALGVCQITPATVTILDENRPIVPLNFRDNVMNEASTTVVPGNTEIVALVDISYMYDTC